MKTRRFQPSVALIGVTLWLLLSVGCAAPPTQTPAPPPTKATVQAPQPAATALATAGAKTAASVATASTTLKVGQTGLIQDVPMFIAMERGYFKELGLTIEPIKFNNSAEQMAPLGTGQIDMGSGGTNTAIFNGIARGTGVRIVADATRNTPSQSVSALVVRKDLFESGKVKDYADLKGLKIGTGCTSGCSADIELARALEKGNLALKDVTVTQMSWPDVNVAFANKAIDAALLVEPFVVIGEAQGSLVRLKKSQEFYPGHQSAVYMYSQKLMEKNPDAARRFMVGLIKGKRDFVEAIDKGKDRDAVYAIIVKFTAIKDLNLIEKMRLAGSIGGVNPDGFVNADSIKYDMDWIAANGYMPSAPPLKDVFDNQWIDYAIQQLGHYK